jgi:hypothetical protein
MSIKLPVCQYKRGQSSELGGSPWECLLSVGRASLPGERLCERAGPVCNEYEGEGLGRGAVIQNCGGCLECQSPLRTGGDA